MHRGMRYARLEALGGIQWPCPDEEHPGSPFLHGRLWADPPKGRTRRSASSRPSRRSRSSTPSYPIRLTTGRRLDSFNTGVQTSGYRSPLQRGETLDLSPEDASASGSSEGEVVRVSSRRGPSRRRCASIVAPPGLAFMTFHFPDDVDTNLLTIDATDPKSGTAEFKAAAIRIEKLAPSERAVGVGERESAEAKV